METVNFKIKHPVTGQNIAIGQGVIDRSVLDLDNKYLVDNSILNISYFRRTGKTFFDAQRGLCEYISLTHITTGEIVNPEVGWVYIDPKPEFQNIKGWLGFFKAKHNGLVIDSSAKAQDSELK